MFYNKISLLLQYRIYIYLLGGLSMKRNVIIISIIFIIFFSFNLLYSQEDNYYLESSPYVWTDGTTTIELTHFTYTFKNISYEGNTIHYSKPVYRIWYKITTNSYSSLKWRFDNDLIYVLNNSLTPPRIIYDPKKTRNYIKMHMIDETITCSVVYPNRFVINSNKTVNGYFEFDKDELEIYNLIHLIEDCDNDSCFAFYDVNLLDLMN